MIIDFKEKFEGDALLIKISQSATNILTLLVLIFALYRPLDKICEKTIQTENMFQNLVLTAPIYLGYCLFYWMVFSWVVYYAIRSRYHGPENKN